jgi:hypothetical protein
MLFITYFPFILIISFDYSIHWLVIDTDISFIIINVVTNFILFGLYCE